MVKIPFGTTLQLVGGHRQRHRSNSSKNGTSDLEIHRTPAEAEAIHVFLWKTHLPAGRTVSNRCKMCTRICGISRPPSGHGWMVFHAIDCQRGAFPFQARRWKQLGISSSRAVSNLGGSHQVRLLPRKQEVTFCNLPRSWDWQQIKWSTVEEGGVHPLAPHFNQFTDDGDPYEGRDQIGAKMEAQGRKRPCR